MTKKEALIQVRVTKVLKESFDKKLKEDGINQTDFLMTCVLNYLKLDTIPKKLWGDFNENK